MEKMTDNILKVTFNQLFEVELPKVGRFELIVKYHNINYKFLLNLLENSDRLIVLSSRTIDNNSNWNNAQPRFSQLYWDFEDSTINFDNPTSYVNDKILYDWCIGTDRIWYLNDMSNIIKIISNKINFENKNLLFYGNSAGGFTSLLLSTLIKDSVSIAKIPQLDITKYENSRHWINIKKYCFDNQDDETIIYKYKHRLKVIELIKKENYIPNAFIILDATETNFETQGLSFIQELYNLNFNMDTNNVKFYIHDQNNEHANLDYEDALPIIKNIKLLTDVESSSLNVNDIFNLDAIEDSKFNNVQFKNISTILVNKENEINNLQEQLKNTNNELNLANQKFGEKEFRLTNQINTLSKQLVKKEKNELELNNQISDANNEINSLKNSLNEKNNILKSKELEFNNQISDANNEINSLKNSLSKKENSFSEIERSLNLKISNKNKNIRQKDKEIKIKQQKLLENENKINSLKNGYINQFNEINTKEYCIKCFKDEICNNNLEIDYLKNNILIKKVLSPFSYLYLIFKSKPNEITLNIKLYRILKKSKCFDIGFYLNNNDELQGSKWCNYFSPELHYVCKGFDEGRKFNKKYFNRNSKIELLEYLLICQNSE